jgi:gliding motility-associated-like protein
MPFLLLIVCFLFIIPSAIAETLQPAPIKFVKNQNQWEKDVLYRAEIPGGFLFVKSASLSYVFYDTKAVSDIHAHAQNDQKAKVDFAQPSNDLIKAHGIEVLFLQANTTAVIEASGESADKRNYFLSKDPSHWASDVSSFTELYYRNIYPGIDLRLYTQHGSLKYEFIVAPKADVNQIRLQYRGASEMYLQDGVLQIKTSVNTISETKPYTYQEVNGKETEVASTFVLKGNIVQFDFPKGYNKKLPLVIDPYLVFSTYSGSFTDNWGFTATYDGNGNLYSGGIEFGNRFPATIGAFQFKFAGYIDVAILKYSPDGRSLLFATYLGGDGAEVPHSMIVNARNELVVMGTTSSANFPTTMNAYDQTFNGGDNFTPMDGVSYVSGSDLFLAKLNSTGNILTGSTLLGGSRNDGINVATNVTRSYGDQFRGEVNIDKENNIYIVSTTVSADFPLFNPVSASLQGNYDAIIAKFDPELTTLLWSTFFGGSGFDTASGIRIGESGSIYICGGTTSRNLPISEGALKPVLSDAEDGYLAKFLNDALVSATYIGTSSRDIAYLLDLDNDENVYVMGLTFGNYPTTGGVYLNANGKQFIHAMSNDFTQTLFSTVIGSGRNGPDISPTAFMVNECGLIYLSGWGGTVNRDRGIASSNTIGLPTTPDALRRDTHRHTLNDNTVIGDDFYLMILDQNASNLLYATFFGSPVANNHVDGGTSRFDKKGTVYHAACSCRDSNRFPTTPGAWSVINRGDVPGNSDPNDGCNNVAFKFDLDGLKADFNITGNGTPGMAQGCVPFSASFANATEGGKTYEWDIAGMSTSTSLNPSTFVFDKPGEYTVTLKAYNPQTCKKVDIVSKVIKVYPAAFNVSPGVKVCPGESAQLRAQGGIKYEWSPVAGLSDPASAEPVASPRITTNYTVTITNEYNCVERRNVLVEVQNDVSIDFNLVIDSECGRPAMVRFKNNTSGADRFLWMMGNGDTLTGEVPEQYQYPIEGGIYEVLLKVFSGSCEYSSSQLITIENGELPPNIITPNDDEANQTFIAPNANSQLEIYNRWGKPIYQSNSYQNDWGPNVPHGVYFYQLTSPQGTRCKGWIHVLK